MFNLKRLAVAAFFVTATFVGATIASATGACACEPEPPEPPKPEPKPVKTETKHEGQEAICPAESTQVSVLKKVGELEKDELVSVRNGDRTVTKRGGDHKVTRVLSKRSVCVTMVSKTTTVAPVATKKPANRDERPDCNPEPGMVCAEGVYTGKYSRRAG